MELSWFVSVLKVNNTNIPSDQKLYAAQKMAHYLYGPNFVRISFGSTLNAEHLQNSFACVAELFILYASKGRTQMLDLV